MKHHAQWAWSAAVTQPGDESALIVDMTASGDAAPRNGSEPLHDHDVRMWNRFVFCVVAAAWTPLAMIAWLAVAIAVFGWRGDGTLRSSTVFAETSAEAVLSLVMALMMLGIGSIVLVALARWAIPVRRTVSLVAALIAISWAPIGATVWAVFG